MIIRRRGGRARVVKWLDGLSGSPIQVAASGLLIIAGVLVLLVWGAALGSSWLINGRMAEITMTDAVQAMVHLGSNNLAWDNVWPEPIEAELAGPQWFWVVFVAELAALALLFWPIWRIIGPNPGDPSAVYVYPTPVNHPRGKRHTDLVEAEEQAERELEPQRVEIVTGPRRPMVDTASMVPSVDRLLVDGSDGERLVLGRLGSKLVAADGQRSAIVLGPSHSGGSAGLVAPAVNEWRGPVVIVASRPDVVTGTWAQRSSLGRTWLFDPTRAMSSATGVTVTGPKVGHGWSPLTSIEAAGADRSESAQTRRNRQWETAQAMARTMIDAVRAPVRSDGSAVGAGSAERLLSALLLATVVDDSPLSQLVTWVDRRSGDEVSTALGRSGVPEAERAWSSGLDDEPSTVSAAYQLLDRALQPYDDGAVLARSDDPEISVPRLFQGGADTLYVIAPVDQDRLRPLMVPLLWEVLDGALVRARQEPSGRFEPPVLVVLEETARYVPPAVLDDLAAGGGAVGIQLLTLTPDLSTLDRALGDDRARRVLGHHRARVALPGLTDPATIDELSSQAEGTRVVQDPGDDGSTGVTVDGAGDWLRALQPGEAMALHGTLPPIRMRLLAPARRPAAVNGGGQPAWGQAPSSGGRPAASGRPSSAGRRGFWNRPFRRAGGAEDDPMTSPSRQGMPDPLDSDANDRAAASYWESVSKSGSLPGSGRGSLFGD